MRQAVLQDSERERVGGRVGAIEHAEAIAVGAGSGLCAQAHASTSMSAVRIWESRFCGLRVNISVRQGRAAASAFATSVIGGCAGPTPVPAASAAANAQ